MDKDLEKLIDVFNAYKGCKGFPLEDAIFQTFIKIKEMNFTPNPKHYYEMPLDLSLNLINLLYKQYRTNNPATNIYDFTRPMPNTPSDIKDFLDPSKHFIDPLVVILVAFKNDIRGNFKGKICRYNTEKGFAITIREEFSKLYSGTGFNPQSNSSSKDTKDSVNESANKDKTNNKDSKQGNKGRKCIVFPSYTELLGHILKDSPFSHINGAMESKSSSSVFPHLFRFPVGSSFFKPFVFYKVPKESPKELNTEKKEDSAQDTDAGKQINEALHNDIIEKAIELYKFYKSAGYPDDFTLSIASCLITFNNVKLHRADYIKMPYEMAIGLIDHSIKVCKRSNPEFSTNQEFWSLCGLKSYLKLKSKDDTIDKYEKLQPSPNDKPNAESNDATTESIRRILYGSGMKLGQLDPSQHVHGLSLNPKMLLCDVDLGNMADSFSAEVISKYDKPVEAEQPKPQPPTKDETILEEAARILGGDRQADYGDPVRNFINIAKEVNRWCGTELSPLDCVNVHIATKTCREQFRHKRDNQVDLVAYQEIKRRIIDWCATHDWKTE